MRKTLEKTIITVEVMILIIIVSGLAIRYCAGILMFLHNGDWPRYVIGGNPCENFLYRTNFELWDSLGDIAYSTWILTWFLVLPYALLKSLYRCYCYFTKKNTNIGYIPITLLIFSLIGSLPIYGGGWLLSLVDDLTWDYPPNYCEQKINGSH